MKNQTGNLIMLFVTPVTLAGTLALTPAVLVAKDGAANNVEIAQAKPPKELQSSTVPAQDKWRLDIVPFGWMTGIDGNVTVRGHTADLDVSFDKLIKHIHGPPLMLYLEARKNKFGFYAEPIYIKLRADGTAGPLTASDELSLWMADGGGFYQIGQWCQRKPLTLDAIAGARYWNLHNALTLKGTGGRINFSGAQTQSLIDPLIGLRARKYLTAKLNVQLRGDIGGFGISNSSSDFSWQAIGLLGYDFCKHFSLFTGYRALGLDNESGNGSSSKGADIIMKGAIIAFDFHW